MQTIFDATKQAVLTRRSKRFINNDIYKAVEKILNCSTNKHSIRHALYRLKTEGRIKPVDEIKTNRGFNTVIFERVTHRESKNN